MRFSRFGLSLLLILSIDMVNAQSNTIESFKKKYITQNINKDNSPTIDGKLDEVIWNNRSSWETNFIQRLPNEGQQPSLQTAFKIVYDDKFLYVGIQCFDHEPNLINRRMSRRDGYNGDWVEIIFDSYHDLRSAFSFTISPASVKSDKNISLNGATEDLAWNPIWYAKSKINNNGWTAEMKIPLSQLRFGDNDSQVWGLQVQRRLLRKEELSVWQRVPLNAPGWISEFGELHGLKNVSSQRQLEIQPFTVSSLNTFEKDPLNPYKNKNIKSVNAGLDGKIGVTNDLTLDFTINPDFGQVEADPAAIALDGFQLFFREQRPFFIENKNIFNYQFSAPQIGGQYSTDNLFYSRRIGRSPQGSATTMPGEFVDADQQTTILGAVKFSGKTKNGLSVGILESMTSSEHAEISGENGIRNQLIEPFTNYFVGRIQKDFNNRNTFIGGIITSTIRRDSPSTSFLHKSAHTGGLDFMHQWKNRTWYLSANLVMSQVTGTPESILATQRSIPHLFQRENASHVSVDGTKTSLTGTGGDLKFGKAGSGHIQFESGITWRSPELELNDIGFMREADVIQNYFGITYSSINSFGSFRNASIGYKHWVNGDFGGNLNYIDWDIEANATWKNNWAGTLGFFSQPHTFSKSLLQGGPRIQLADQSGFWWALNSDARKKLFINFSGWTKTGGTGSYYLLENSLGITYQPIDRLKVSISPRYTSVKHRLQYNHTRSFQGQNRYITSMLDQETFSTPIRLDFAINANLGIQYYGEPFITTGRYSRFNYVANALSSIENGQLVFYSQEQISLNEAETLFSVDENNDGAVDYNFNNPDFSFAQFRSNLVLRYEYTPGSEIFIVWSQGISDVSSPRNNLFSSLREQVFSKVPNNTFLIKLTYRFHK